MPHAYFSCKSEARELETEYISSSGHDISQNLPSISIMADLPAFF
jgi:hypothetical protein